MADNMPGNRTAPRVNSTPVESPQNSPSGRFNLCGAALSSASLFGRAMRIALGARGQSVVDRSVGLGQFGVLRKSPPRGEMQIADNGKILGSANAFQNG